jgi:hypothetical protein
MSKSYKNVMFVKWVEILCYLVVGFSLVSMVKRTKYFKSE